MRRPCGRNRKSYRYCTWNSVHSRAEARPPTGYFLALVMQRVMLRKQLCRSWPRTSPWGFQAEHQRRQIMCLRQIQIKDRRICRSGCRLARTREKRQRVTGHKTGSCFWQERLGATPAGSDKPSKAGRPSSKEQAPSFRAVSIVPSTFMIRRLLRRTSLWIQQTKAR